MDTSYPNKATPLTPIAWLVIVALVVGLIGLIFFGITTYLKQQSMRNSGVWVSIEDDRNIAVGSVK